LWTNLRQRFGLLEDLALMLVSVLKSPLVAGLKVFPIKVGKLTGCTWRVATILLLLGQEQVEFDGL
jgi:hypothetical protein